MKKTILKRILVFTIVFLMIISTPFSIYGNLYNNNIYVYASTATFEQMLNTELMKHFIIATGISAGLVFATVEAEWAYTEAFKTYLNTIGPSYRPDGPDGPDLEQLIKAALIGSVVWSAGKQVYKLGMWLDDAFWELVKSFVDDNYDEGENFNTTEYVLKANQSSFQIQPYSKYFVTEYHQNFGHLWAVIEIKDNPYDDTRYHLFVNNNIIVNLKKTDPIQTYYGYVINNGNIGIRIGFNTVYDWNIIGIDEPPIKSIYGTSNIVDNINYDWNNNYTDTKVIPVPIEMDPYGNPKTDENGYYLPLIDVDEWLDVQPTEIPNLDPTGTPIPDIPPFPDIENPDDDEKTGILIYIGNILQLIVGQLSKIAEGVKTIVANTNQLVFNTPNPVFDPTTGQQIDPETGQPVEPEPEASTGDGIIGDGIDTNIPTDFEWGDFRHLLDIFFIFIYFIVILILILLKFLQIVFTGLPGIAANTDLFTAYPEILAGVNYVKNLQVGGMSITVQQAFEYIFMIFFYIFVIKQIRKLYNAHVFEQSAEDRSKINEMKMDYYEKRTNQINEFNDWYHK